LDDTAARQELLDALVRDGLAVVIGQDTEADADGRFRIARRVCSDRVIFTVDPDARHGHKSSARGFDGYKDHAAVDPDWRDRHRRGGGPGWRWGRGDDR
jgi:hypothetical protein